MADVVNRTDAEPELLPADAPFESGFNLKTVWASLLVGFVLLPGAIYLGLVTGQSMAGGAEWVTIVLFLEIARRAFIRLKPQEVIIIYWVAGGLVQMGGKLGMGANLFGGPFGGLIWNQYLVQSPQAATIAQYIPTWACPPRGSEAILARTFFHVDWLKPTMLLLLWIVFSRINALSLGYVLFRITSDLERLPFPMAPVQAGGATALAETSAGHESWRWRVFSIGSCVGVLFGLVYVVVPTLSGLFLTDTVMVLPIPFIDTTTTTEAILPASPTGVGTDLLHVLIGMVLPFWIVVGQFIGSMSAMLVLNPMLYREGILSSWSPGMSAIPTFTCNYLDFWLSVTIGLSLVVAVMGISLAVVQVRRRRRELRAAGVDARSTLPEGRGDMPIWLALGIWAVTTAVLVVAVMVLVPDFPWWITAAFGFVWTPLASYIGARMIGLTGSPYGSSFPYLREGSFLLSGYQGVGIWFAPMPMFNHAWQVNAFKQMELTRTKFSSLVWVTLLTLVVMFVCSFIFWSLVWQLARVPSSAYPYVQKMWPFHATMQTLWAGSTMPGSTVDISTVINWRYILAGFGGGCFLLGALRVLGAPILIFYGVTAGLPMWPHFVIPQFAGALLGRYVFARRFGEKRWRAYAPILLAGFSCGMGLIGMTSVAVALIAKSISPLVF